MHIKKMPDATRSPDPRFPVHYTIDYIGLNGNSRFKFGKTKAHYENPLSLKDVEELRATILRDQGFDTVTFLNVYRHER